MTREEISIVVTEVLAAERAHAVNSQDTTVLKTVSAILVTFGIDDDDRLEFRADLMHLRRWRKSTEHVQKVGIGAIITILVGGFLGAVWLGIQIMVNR